MGSPPGFISLKNVYLTFQASFRRPSQEKIN
jgi:hypothetical protein